MEKALEELYNKGFKAGQRDLLEKVKKYVKDNRDKIERMDRYVLDDLVASLEELTKSL